MSEQKKINLDKIIAISGEPGLYKIISSTKTHVIVENLQTRQRTSISTLTRISQLNDIAMYVRDGEKPLAEIFYVVYEKMQGGPAISHKAEDQELRKALEEILPEYDREKVYVSNIRKFFSWYNILQQSGCLEVVQKESQEENQETNNITTEKNNPTSPPAALSGEKTPKTPKKPVQKDTTKIQSSSTNIKPRKTTPVRKSGSS